MDFKYSSIRVLITSCHPGDAFANEDFVRLTPDRQSKRGGVWNSQKMAWKNFELMVIVSCCEDSVCHSSKRSGLTWYFLTVEIQYQWSEQRWSGRVWVVACRGG